MLHLVEYPCASTNPHPPNHRLAATRLRPLAQQPRIVPSAALPISQVQAAPSVPIAQAPSPCATESRESKPWREHLRSTPSASNSNNLPLPLGPLGAIPGSARLNALRHTRTPSCRLPGTDRRPLLAIVPPANAVVRDLVSAALDSRSSRLQRTGGYWAPCNEAPEGTENEGAKRESRRRGT